MPITTITITTTIIANPVRATDSSGHQVKSSSPAGLCKLVGALPCPGYTAPGIVFIKHVTDPHGNSPFPSGSSQDALP